MNYSLTARRAGNQCVQGADVVVTTFAARVGSADRQFVQGALRVVTSLTRSIRSIAPIESVGDGFPVPAGMAGTKSAQGADVIVTTFAAR